MSSLRRFSTIANETSVLAETGKLWEALGSKASTSWVATAVGTALLTGFGAIGSGIYFAVDCKFNAVDNKLQTMDHHIGSVDRKIEALSSKIDKLTELVLINAR